MKEHPFITHGGRQLSETDSGIRHSLLKSKVTAHETEELQRTDGVTLTSISAEASTTGIIGAESRVFCEEIEAAASASLSETGSRNGAFDLKVKY